MIAEHEIGQTRVRCRIEGSYRGERWSYEDPSGVDGSQFLWFEDDGQVEPSEYWWTEGNMGCDCNRSKFLPPEMADIAGESCGDEIRIDRVVPLVDGAPEDWTLVLNESEGQAP